MSLALATSARWFPAEPGVEEGNDLVERARTGDAEAFRSLHDRHAPKLRGHLAAHVRDSSLVDDLVQETFTSAWLALPRYESRGVPFHAWLCRIAHNKAVDAYRRSRPAASLDLIDHSGVREPSDIEERALQAERREALLRAPHSFAPGAAASFAAPLLWRTVVPRGRQMTGTKPATLRGQQLRALRSLRKLLDEDAFE